MASKPGRIVACPKCGVKNRISPEKEKLTPKCGKCGVSLKSVASKRARPVTVTDATFDAEVMRAQLPVLLDCWAAWCGPCRSLGPIIDRLAGRWQGRIKVAKLDVDANPRTSSRFSIMSVPSLLVFHKGALKDTMVGALPENQIVGRMKSYLK